MSRGRRRRGRGRGRGRGRKSSSNSAAKRAKPAEKANGDEDEAEAKVIQSVVEYARHGLDLPRDNEDDVEEALVADGQMTEAEWRQSRMRRCVDRLWDELICQSPFVRANFHRIFPNVAVAADPDDGDASSQGRPRAEAS